MLKKLKLLPILLLAITFNIHAQNDSIFINEIMLSNSITLADEDDDYPDWIEIYNAKTSPVNLEGFGLSDDYDDPFKWVFPSVVIPPESFLVVFASGKDRISGANLHTNFKLDSNGEWLQLTAPSSILVDQIAPVSLSTDISYGRAKDGDTHLESLSFSSPHASNTSVNGITFSHHSGFYTSPLTFEMSSNNGDPIYYTIDGSDPSTSSSLFNGSIELGFLDNHPDVLSNISTSPYWTAPNTDQFNAHVIKAATFNNGAQSSKVYHKTIFIDENMESMFDDFHLLSIITDRANLFDQDTGIYVPGVHFDPSNTVWTGNYFQKGIEWERKGHFQYFAPDGKLLLDQSVGLRIHGGKGRNFPQKSFRFYARSEYGSPKINYPFFTDQSDRIFDKLIIRNSMSCWNKTIFKDECTAKVCEDLNFESLDSMPVIVFINGEYWGMQTIREYFDQHYVTKKFGYDKDSINIVIHLSGNRPDLPPEWGTIEGSNEGKWKLYNFLNDNDLSESGNYQYVKTLLDMQSIIDYYCAEVYFNNKDWPRYNNKLWSYGTKGRWRQIMFDIDGGWGYLGNSYNFLSCISKLPGCSVQTQADGTFLFRKLIESQEFKDEFAQRMACLMRNEFEASRVNAIVEDFKAQYINGLSEHIGRWNYPNSITSWENSISSKLINFSNNRKEHIIEHIAEEFNISFNPEDYDCEKVITSTRSVAKSFEKESLTIIPNPSYTNYISLDYTFETDQVYYEIYSLNGQCLQKGMTTKQEKIELDFESGIYLIQILVKDQLFTKKIILLNP